MALGKLTNKRQQKKLQNDSTLVRGSHCLDKITESLHFFMRIKQILHSS